MSQDLFLLCRMTNTRLDINSFIANKVHNNFGRYWICFHFLFSRKSFLLEGDSVTTTIVDPYPYCWERTLFLLIKLVAASGRAVTRARKQDYY